MEEIHLSVAPFNGFSGRNKKGKYFHQRPISCNPYCTPKILNWFEISEKKKKKGLSGISGSADQKAGPSQHLNNN